MNPNHFPKIRKAPSAVVLFALLAVLAPLLASCTSDEGSEYDVPAGEQVQDLRLEVDADGTPVLLAEVGMFYGTKARLQQWESPYIQANVQTIAFIRTAGGWDKHPFRNIKSNWNLNSVLVRNYKEEVRAIIADRSGLSLFERNAGDWDRKSSSKAPNFQNVQIMTFSGGGYALIMEGDGAWRSLIFNYQTRRMEVLGNNGASFALDTGTNISLLGSVSRAGFNMVFGTREGAGDTASHNGGAPGESGLFSYAWTLGDADPATRKRKISSRRFASLFFAKVDGQDRMYGLIAPDTLAEFSMQGEELVFRRDLELPIEGRPGTVTDPETDPGTDFKTDPFAQSKSGSGLSYGADLMVDPAGCVHYIGANFTAAGSTGLPGGQTSYSHGSTCRAGTDTLVLPKPDTVHAYQSRIAGFRFSPQGELVMGMTQTREPKDPNRYDSGARPSWIYLARLKGRTWEWEKVAEFEGSGEDTPSR